MHLLWLSIPELGGRGLLLIEQVECSCGNINNKAAPSIRLRKEGSGTGLLQVTGHLLSIYFLQFSFVIVPMAALPCANQPVSEVYGSDLRSNPSHPGSELLKSSSSIFPLFLSFTLFLLEMGTTTDKKPKTGHIDYHKI